MDQKPQFSVLLSFQNQRDDVEPSLTALFELKTIPFELIIIDDASTDGTTQAIHSLLDYYQHEHTFFFEHTHPASRGSCLNEALQQANTPVIWAPASIESIQEELLKKSLNSIIESEEACFCQPVSLPTNITDWIAFIQEEPKPANGQFLFNLTHLPSHKPFYNPFLSRYHSLEWIVRTGMGVKKLDENFFTQAGADSHPTVSTSDKQELIMSLLRRPGVSSDHRQTLLEMMRNLPSISDAPSPVERDHDLLQKAEQLKKDGQLSAALECVEKVLANDQTNPEAKYLKIKLLERKRRFVEASELKHELQANANPKKVHPEIASDAIKTSLVIPTALYGKPALEHCLLSVNKYCNAASTELIIIDNASLDDTHAYLGELQEKNFFNCTIITNPENKGFATSINQGLDAASGQYACIIHNDVEFDGPAITALEELMEDYPDYTIMGPLANSTLNPDQLISNEDLYDGNIKETDFLDSFCLMVRTDADIRMDEKYTLAFFDDIDFCFQARKAGHKVGIAPNVQLIHHYGTTTFKLELDTESELYWKNRSYFNDKWNVQTYSEEELQSKSTFDQLLALDQWANPLFPEPTIKEKFNELFTDELKTEILKSTHEPNTLLHLVHLMMVMENREVMRRLEDRIGDIELPATLIYEIVRFYFNRNVYSRCQHYLQRLTASQESLQSELYWLAMLIDEKKMGDAIPLLKELLKKAPSNPMLYKLAGDVHAFQNNTEEAESFYSLAHQINPFNFTETQKEIRLNS